MNSLQEALDLCRDEEEVFIIGGAYVYSQTLPIADKLYLTVIDDAPEDADAYFPTVNYEEWDVELKEEHTADERHAHDYVFLNLVRK